MEEMLGRLEEGDVVEPDEGDVGTLFTGVDGCEGGPVAGGGESWMTVAHLGISTYGGIWTMSAVTDVPELQTEWDVMKVGCRPQLPQEVENEVRG